MRKVRIDARETDGAFSGRYFGNSDDSRLAPGCSTELIDGLPPLFAVRVYVLGKIAVAVAACVFSGSLAPVTIELLV